MKRVALRVSRQAEWLAVSKLCPTEVIPKRRSPDAFGDNECRPTFDGCLTKCEGGDGNSCYWLAYEAQQEGLGTETYSPLYQRACSLGVISGCTNRAAEIRSSKPNDPEAQKCTAQTFRLACDLDDPWACTMFALQLGRGEGVARDDALALRVLQKSCVYGNDDPACQRANELKAQLLRRQGVSPKP
ncbi:MAG: sel1 repeat family protein [Acidobacteria bacterium]|nr:sel1 repeat family protein [Acidobacteriota bacterium]